MATLRWWMRTLVEILAIWSACHAPGCESQGAGQRHVSIPDIYLPDMRWHDLEPRRKWQQAVTEAGDLLARGDELATKATGAIYSLVDPERVSILVPLIDEPGLRQKIIFRAQRENVFAWRNLNEAEALEMRDAWANLAGADRLILSAQTIVAELRQKWRWWLWFPYLPDLSYFPELARGLQDLPTVGEIALRRSDIHGLMNICRQLSAANPLLTPPYDFDDDGR